MGAGQEEGAGKFEMMRYKMAVWSDKLKMKRHKTPVYLERITLTLLHSERPK